MAPKTIMERSKGVISESGKLVFMDNFIKRHRENNRRTNREIDMAMERQAAVAEDLITDPDRTARTARLASLSMDAQLFGTARTGTADLRSNEPLLSDEVAAMSKAGSRIPAKNPTEIVSTADMNALLSGKKPATAVAAGGNNGQPTVRSLGRLESSPPGAAKPQQKRARAKKMFGGFDLRRGGLGGRARCRGEEEGDAPSRASSAYPGAPTDPSVIPRDLLDVNRGFWPKAVRERVEAAEATEAEVARSRGAARRLRDAAEKAEARRRERRRRDEKRWQREEKAERERRERKKKKAPSPVGRKRKAETVEESESDEEPVVVPAKKIRRVGKLRGE